MVHKYQDNERMFACVRRTKKLEQDHVKLKFFSNLDGPLQFIEVIGIDRNVGFFKVGKNDYYIIDKYVNW
jgi:hypothetical protein